MHRALRLSAFVLGQPAVPNTRGAGSLAGSAIGEQRAVPMQAEQGPLRFVLRGSLPCKPQAG